MYIRSISQKNFRNLITEKIEFSKTVTLFIGDNGQGKTNLLEAIYFLIRGNSFRTPKVHHLIHNNQEGTFVKGELSNKNLVHNIEINLQTNKRQINLNNKKVSASKLIENFPIVLFSPESLAAIKDGPEERRRLLDDLLISHHPQNAKLIAEFSKCLRTRNKLLRDYKQEKISRQEVEDVIESLDGSYLPLAVKLSFARISALGEMKNDFQEATRSILDLPNVEIAVDYLISSQSAGQWEQKQVYYALLSRREELLKSEIDSGMTLFGPHRHDIQFLFDNVDSRYYCSQGQQRTLILAFKMAQVMYHQRVHQDFPLLLLDDVLSELDQKKGSNLIAFLKRLDSQIIITTTDLNFSEDFGKNNLEVYRIAQGEVTRNG